MAPVAKTAAIVVLVLVYSWLIGVIVWHVVDRVRTRRKSVEKPRPWRSF